MLAGLLILAAVLRLHAIAGPSLWLDETDSWDEAHRSFATMIELTSEDFHPPLYNVILYLFVHAFGDSETVMRLPSAILGIAAVGAIYWVASSLEGRLVGLLAAALLCVSGYHIEYSQDARPYALLCLTSILFAGASIRALETDRFSWHLASAIGALLLLYSHAYGALLWLSVAIAVGVSAVAWRDPGLRTLLRWAAGQIVAGLLFLPWSQFLAERYQHILTYGFWLPHPTGDFMLALVTNVASGGPMVVALLAGSIVALAPSRWFVPRTWQPGESHEALRRAILIAWLLGPLAIGLLLSIIGEPILNPRYVIGSLLAWLILGSIGLCRVLRIGGRPVLVGGLVLALAGAAMMLWLYQPIQHEDARGTVKTYAEQAVPTDCVFVIQSAVGGEVIYYLRAQPACYLSTDDPADITPWSVSSRRSWLFLGYVNAKNRGVLAENLKTHGWQTRPVILKHDVSLLILEPAS